MGGLHVPIDRIVPLTDARDNFSKIVAEIENHREGLYVLTKGGKPSIALISIQYLEDMVEGRNNPSAVLPRKEVETAGQVKSEDRLNKPEPPAAKFNKAIDEPILPVLKTPLQNKPDDSKAKPVVPPVSSEPKVNQNIPPSSTASQVQTKDEKPVINPTWTGINSAKPADSASQAAAKPVTPWPIIEPKPDPSLPSDPVPPKMPQAPAISGLNEQTNKQSQFSAPANNPPAPLPGAQPPKQPPPPSAAAPTATSKSEPSQNVAVKINNNTSSSAKDLPPPPTTPPAIPFDEPPKIDLEAGEKPPADKPSPPPPPANPSASSNPNNTNPSSSVADLDI